jgi:hypothetical protein
MNGINERSAKKELLLLITNISLINKIMSKTLNPAKLFAAILLLMVVMHATGGQVSLLRPRLQGTEKNALVQTRLRPVVPAEPIMPTVLLF